MDKLNAALALATSQGKTSLVPPNDFIRETGEERTFDGVKFVIQMVPGTEAPSEFNFFLHDQRALYIAECAVQGMRNIITLRGALVREHCCLIYIDHGVWCAHTFRDRAARVSVVVDVSP